VATAATSEVATAGQNYRGGHGGRYQAGRGGFSGPQSLTQTHKVKCYNYGELGHMSRECPQKRANAHDGHHRLQGLGGSSATTAQDGDIWPENVRQCRVVDLVVSGEVGAAGIKVVPEVMDRTKKFASTWCQRTKRPR